MSENGQGSKLTGNFRVRAVRASFSAVRRLFPKAADRAEIRRQALKLRFWPEKKPAMESGRLLDLDWDWIRALKGLDIGELRIADEIGGLDNIRVVFFVGNKKVRQPLPIIWVLHVMQRKRMEFTAADLATFKARRLLVIEWFYRLRS
ncbi:MAG: hypothetical protein BWX88_02119 [Planctomycetes bacterium ADurb.Bin126]|nr:MAG: hypothetical protein BWX88_02119 [Planctomycetes bacterium ADurb.Bin126]HOD83043.1 hypothetical protein [Phycisphaerae bacterium]HQL74226.1 hypothetical protein [Phycisphaerae bacterium]